MKPIPGEGRADARLVLIGEAGGETEARLGRPFVGASGFKLNSWWHPLGLARADFYIDNVYPFHPPRNDLAAILRDDYAHVAEWAEDLHARLAELVDPWVIVPTGNIALRALMRVALDDQSIKISKYRGSIMQYTDDRGRAIKMIPTIHPASIYHQRAKKARGQEKSNPGRTEKHCVFDWRRIAREAQSREIAAPEETYYIVDQADDCAYWRHEFEQLPPETIVTIDIETPHRVVDCVGFSWDPSFSITVPLRWPGYEDPEHPSFAARHNLIETICEDACAKNLQYGFFDIFWLWRKEAIAVHNYRYDTKYMHHALDPVDDHDLGYMKSVFLRGQYHKDEAKGDAARKYADSYQAMLTYNGMDCCAQNRLASALSERLVAAGRWDLYETCYAPLLGPLAALMLGGINTSRDMRRFANANLVADCIDIQDKLAALAGTPLHAKKSLSGKKVKTFLYETLRLPVQRKRGAKGKPGAITADEITLRKLQLRFPQQCGEAIPLMLDHNRKIKLSQFLTDTQTDDDGRLRCVYEPVTEAGRLSSSKNPFGTGTNLQNQDRDATVRGSFIPDRPDHVFLEVDCSQAESRIVYVLSGDDDLYALAVTPPDQFDQHCYNAALIFGAQPRADSTYKYRATNHDGTVIGYVSAEQRYFGKRTVHGAQRGMGGEKMADELLKEDVVKTPEECQRAIDRYLSTHPGMGGYFEWVRTQVLRNNALTNSWGFRWSVEFERKEADLYRRAYSFLPQSEVAFLLNAWGLVPVAEFIDTWYGAETARVVAQVHDSVLVSVLAEPSIIASIAGCMAEHLTQPRVYQTRSGPRELTMPVEFKLGSSWAFPEKVEWKRLPTRDEIAEALATKMRSAA